jgi:hypothetical protein
MNELVFASGMETTAQMNDSNIKKHYSKTIIPDKSKASKLLTESIRLRAWQLKRPVGPM